MSYHSKAEGGFTIDPPLNSQEIRNFPELPTRTGSKYRNDEIELAITETIEERPEGDLHVKVAYEVNPREPDAEWSRGRTNEQLQAVVDAYPTHEFIGYIEFLGEDGALWRLYVHNRKVVTVEPRIIWEAPDGLE